MRTFEVEFSGAHASCFVVTHRDRQWLISAMHVVDAAVQNGNATFMLTGENGLNAGLSAPMGRYP